MPIGVVRGRLSGANRSLTLLSTYSRHAISTRPVGLAAVKMTNPCRAPRRNDLQSESVHASLDFDTALLYKSADRDAWESWPKIGGTRITQITIRCLQPGALIFAVTSRLDFRCTEPPRRRDTKDRAEDRSPSGDGQ